MRRQDSQRNESTEMNITVIIKHKQTKLLDMVIWVDLKERHRQFQKRKEKITQADTH